MKIAIVGTGVAGLVAARALDPDHAVTIFEADDRLGGHVNTIDVEVDGAAHSVDTGFIVYNERNYPGFVALLAELGVETQATEMSFSVSDPARNIEYNGTSLNTLFAQRRNVVNPAFIRLLTEIARFNRAARALVPDGGAETGPTGTRLPSPASEVDSDESLAEFVSRGGYSTDFVERFLVPFGASIWSADPATFTRFPAQTYARFMHNHGLLSFTGRPQWRTVTGGSRRYVDALVDRLAGRVRLSSPVLEVGTGTPDGATSVEVVTRHGAERFDRVVIATHSNQALRMLRSPSRAEMSILGALGYQPNVATLHTDERMLPATPRARASWNYTVDPAGQGSTVTYWMNRLQNIESTRPLLVTLNRRDAIADDQVLADLEYDHPVFDLGAIAAQRRRHEIQGRDGVYFAGAYWGYGFHEDGLQSGLEVAAAIAAER